MLENEYYKGQYKEIVAGTEESPVERRSLCYDREALESRKEHKPKNSALDMAVAMGISLITEGEYRDLQKLGKLDMKSSSWVHTPNEIRELGSAFFATGDTTL